MAWWESPLDQNKPPTKIDPVEHLPIVTRRGRVVYDRKIHYFTENDVARISRDVFNVSKDAKGLWWIELLEKLTIWMLEKIFDLVLSEKQAQNIAERIYYVARNMLARIIDNLIDKVQKENAEQVVSGGAH